MIEWSLYFLGLPALILMGAATWLLSLRLRDVSIVDSIWSLFFLLAMGIYTAGAPASGLLSWLTLILVACWALRLSLYLTWRNHGKPEDRRYREMRARHGERFARRSLISVFSLQALLAWIISLPLFAIAKGAQTLNGLALAGIVMAIFGIVYESIADLQLARFLARPAGQQTVLDSGLWRFSRHPNYFGECCVWWGYYLIAVAAGGWWSIFSPLLMTLLLLRVSGVTLLEKDIVSRRPGYADYVRRTNAFLPGPIRKANL